MPDKPPTRMALDPGLPPGALWAAVAQQAGQWCDDEGLQLRDAVLLLPFAALLPSARAAFAAQGGWPPRIETSQTLADALAPPEESGPGLDSAQDRLAAANLLAQTAAGADWRLRDPRAFRLAADGVAVAAASLARAASARPASARAAFWQAGRAAAGPGDGPEAKERALLRLAIEWAAGASAERATGLQALRPSAWIVLQAGGPDPVASGLVEAADVPILLLDVDPPIDDPCIAITARHASPTLLCCDHFEEEAQATAARVLQALAVGHAPVALVALDRQLVRRVRALLERSQVSMADETGWKLSTTRAGARVMAWLRAARAQATADERLAWLKGWPPASQGSGHQALLALEARWRRDGPRAAADDALWQAGQSALAPLIHERGGMLRSLNDWCQSLASALVTAGEWPGLAADPAGAAVLQALKLNAANGPGWGNLAASTSVSLDGFMDWVNDELEAASFSLPKLAGSGAEAEVVLTPLARAVLRPFGHVVVPGVDARHLGSASASPGLIPDALAETLGLETRASRSLRERLAFAQLLRAPALTLLRRRLDGDEPLSASPLLQALMLRRREAGLPPLHEAAAAPAMATLPATPVARPEPVAPQSLPLSLSASQVEQLRACPYQFFARSLLRLSLPDELDRGAGKRDYGSWLHAVLHRFHRQPNVEGEGDDATRLAEAAETELAATGFDPAELLPYRASFDDFAPRYLAWWRTLQAEGWRWGEGETEYRITPPELAPTGLHGRLDRLDELGPLRRLIDYKTTRYDVLSKRVKQPTEDTQLAFYAALLSPREPDTLQGGYLTLDEAEAPRLLLHPQVQQSAQVLLEGLAEDLRQVRAGAALPALGEGAVCDHCDVRGLCRKDHWGPT